MSRLTKDDIFRLVEEEDVEFIRLQFIDIFGRCRNIAVTADKVTFQCDENDTEATRTTTISLSYSGATIVNVTVTQEHDGDGRANLPFEFNGVKADIEATKGLTQEGLGDDYNNSPKLRFDTTGDNLILHFNGRPGTLSFDIKGNGSGSTPWAGTFKVQTSECRQCGTWQYKLD